MLQIARDELEGEVIPAREIVAATTSEVLGKSAEPAKKAARDDSGRNESAGRGDAETRQNANRATEKDIEAVAAAVKEHAASVEKKEPKK